MTKAVAVAAVLSLACSSRAAEPTVTTHPAPVACATADDCTQRPRECKSGLRPACDTCSGLVSACAARSADEIAALDRAKDACEARPHATFSYTEGCRCLEPDCPPPRQWCEDGGGVFTDVGCITGDLRRPE